MDLTTTRAAGLEEVYTKAQALIDSINRYQNTSKSSIARTGYAAQTKALKFELEVLIKKIGPPNAEITQNWY